MGVPSGLKAIARSARNALIYIDGPHRCDHASSIAQEWHGRHTEIYPASSTSFPTPQTNNTQLRAFFEKQKTHLIPAVTITEIPFARVHAGGVVISPDGSAVARDLSVDFGIPFQKHFLCGRRIQRPRQLHGNTLSVNSNGSQSYYHWLLDELPKYLLVPEISFDNIICSRDTIANRTAMGILGLERKSFIFVDDATTRNKHYSTEMLTCPSLVAPTGQPSPLLVELLSQFVDPIIITAASYPPKIYISRANASGRRIVSEDLFVSKLEDLGYVSINLELLSWEEQVNLFYHAREICAPHGAGLANLVFCAHSPRVIEIFNSQYTHWCFWKLSQLVGAEYLPLAFPLEEPDHNAAHCHTNIQLSDSDLSAILCLADETRKKLDREEI
jgi:Glycosyltransferase 61